MHRLSSTVLTTEAAWPGMTVVTRTATTAETYSPRIKQVLLAMDPDQASSGEYTMEDIVYRSMGSRRLPMFMLSAFGAIALLLAAVGISGVVSYSVAQRKQELGIRIAVGANSLDVLKLVVGRSMELDSRRRHSRHRRLSTRSPDSMANMLSA